MKNFIFKHKETNAVLTIQATDFIEADEIIDRIVKDSYLWVVEHEEGE
jgi:hypothetical protein